MVSVLKYETDMLLQLTNWYASISSLERLAVLEQMTIFVSVMFVLVNRVQETCLSTNDLYFHKFVKR